MYVTAFLSKMSVEYQTKIVAYAQQWALSTWKHKTGCNSGRLYIF